MSIPLSKKIAFGQLFVFCFFLSFAAMVFLSLLHIKNTNIKNLETSFWYYRQSEEIKLDVVQVQQFLSDIAATKGQDGLDGGLKEAQKSYDEFIKDVSDQRNLALKNNNTSIVKSLDEIERLAKSYYGMGVKMATLYIKEGTKAGNKAMPEVDEASTQLQQKIDLLLKENSDKFSAEIKNIGQKILFMLNLSVWIPLVVLVLFSVFTYYFIRGLSQNLKTIVKGLVDNTSFLESASLTLYEESFNLSESVSEQGKAVESSVSAVHQISSTINSNAEYACRAEQATSEGVTVTKNGIETLNNVLVAIDGIAHNNMEVIKEMEETNKEVSEIVSIILEIESKTKIINEIVFQTKLLAFNASVEAARAGEAGKGFSVVAEEVGNLSNMSGQAAKDISELLNSGVSKIKEIVEKSNKKVLRLSADGTNKVETSMQVVNQSKEVLDSILENVENIKKMVNEIAIASSEQSTGVQEVSSSFSKIELSIKENSRIAESSTEQSDLLKKQSEKLVEATQDIITLIHGDNVQIEKFEWNEDYRLDVGPMDNEHLILIDKMNVFLELLNQNNLSEIKDAYSDLANYTMEHFAHEEKYQASISYPERENHKRLHKNLVSKVLEYKESLNQGVVNKQGISNFLKSWLALHIVGQDMKYARFSRADRH